MGERALKARLIVEALQKAGMLLEVRQNAPEHIFPDYTTDSRRLSPNGLFIAYRGVSFDAHALLPQLALSHPGAGMIVDERSAWEASQAFPFPFVCLVRDSREAWAFLAAYHHDFPNEHLSVFGVTGTNGKTSTVWYIRQILDLLGEPCLSIGTLGVYLDYEKFDLAQTTPDPDDLFRYLALARQRGCRWAAMEVSSHAVVQKRLGPLRFDGVAFTSFSRDHLDFHASMEEYFAAKWKFIANSRKPGGIAWLSSSLGTWKPANAAGSGCRTYGPAHPGGSIDDLVYTILDMQLSHSEFSLHQGAKTWTGRLSFGGDFAIDNFVAAWALVKSVSGKILPPERWPEIKPVPGRFEPLAEAFAQGFAVIVDYAHTPDALEKTLHRLRGLTPGKLWVVFGCGGDRDKGKRPLMGRAAEQNADRVIVTSDNPRTEDPEAVVNDIVRGFVDPAQARTEVDRREAIRLAINGAASGDTILIAGKGHEDYQLIGKQKLSFDDLKVARSLLAERFP